MGRSPMQVVLSTLCCTMKNNEHEFGNKCFNPLKTESLINNIYINLVRTSRETHYITTTKPNRLMVFGETVAVYCENHMEHTDNSGGRMQGFGMLRKVVTIVTTRL
jgi:hypothetical protein